MGLISGAGRRGRGGRDGASAPEHVRAEHMVAESPTVDRAVMAARENQREKRSQS